MLHRRERTVLHYDVAICATPSVAPTQPLLTIIQQLKTAADKGDAVWLRNKGRAAVRISHVMIYNQGTRAALLMQHANKDTADPSFSQLATGAIRTEPKLQGEGVAVSAHVFVDLTAPTITKSGGTYHLLLESVPGLTRSYILGAIHAVLRVHGQYDFKDVNGVIRPARPLLEFSPRLSECFLQDVAKGKLSNIILLKRENVSDLFDADPDVKAREATLKVVPITKSTGTGAIEVVRKVMKMGRDEGYTNARITYTDEQGKPKYPVFGIDQADTFDALVAKTSAFHVDNDLSQCEARIRSDVSQKMQALLNQHLAGIAA